MSQVPNNTKNGNTNSRNNSPDDQNEVPNQAPQDDSQTTSPDESQNVYRSQRRNAICIPSVLNQVPQDDSQTTSPDESQNVYRSQRRNAICIPSVPYQAPYESINARRRPRRNRNRPSIPNEEQIARARDYGRILATQWGMPRLEEQNFGLPEETSNSDELHLELDRVTDGNSSDDTQRQRNAIIQSVVRRQASFNREIRRIEENSRGLAIFSSPRYNMRPRDSGNSSENVPNQVSSDEHQGARSRAQRHEDLQNLPGPSNAASSRNVRIRRRVADDFVEPTVPRGHQQGFSSESDTSHNVNHPISYHRRKRARKFRPKNTSPVPEDDSISSSALSSLSSLSCIDYSSPDKKVSSSEKNDSSPEKNVSRPEKNVSSSENNDSSSEKNDSSPEKNVSSPKKKL